MNGGSWRVAAYDAVLEAALDEARRRGVYLIARVQDARDRYAVAHNGKLESFASSRAAGLGVQVFTPAGHCGFTSTDCLEPGAAAESVRRAAQLAQSAASLGGEANVAVFGLGAETIREWPYLARRLADLSPEEHREALLEAHGWACDQAAGFSVRSACSVLDEEWRIVRSDGTDVRFGLPRADARHDFTAGGRGLAGSASAGVSGVDAGAFLDTEGFERLRRRAARAVRQAREQATAPTVQAGAYRLVLDHSVAKALAHEAFGHAAETDGAEFSILASDGQLRLGEQVAPAAVSIVDEPIAGDFAYQPASANGMVRESVRIIDRGVLRSGLGDLFSAERAGSPRTGAGRAQSYRSRPMPRMTNIRIECAAPLPLDDPDEALEPGDLAELLRREGLLPHGEPALLLSHWTGGQVNPRLGDFVFNCSAIYDLSNEAAPRQRAVFSGKSLSALNAIVAAVGSLRLDVAGICGKGGQSVATSGGSHAFLVLERRPDVLLGGGR